MNKSRMHITKHCLILEYSLPKIVKHESGMVSQISVAFVRMI